MREAGVLPTILTSLVALAFTMKAHSLEQTSVLCKESAKTMIRLVLGKDP